MANGLTTGGDRTIQTSEETRASEKYIKPAVNIVEIEEGLLLTVDMPGATKESVDVNVERGVLTITAQVSHELPGRQVYTEFELAPYYRQFQVPESLDHSKAVADFSNGVLTLKIPKAEAAKPRKIEIKAA